jgi:1-phosphofructokinase family hexose kinase
LIVTLTLNPALEHTFTVDRLVFEDRGYILSRSESAGGRGINASGVLKSFGADTVAVAVCGGKAGKAIEEYLAGSGIRVELVRIGHDIRTNLTIVDQQGLAIKLNEPGPSLSPPELGRVEKAVCRGLNGARWLMLCGSVPPGVPPDFYARLIRSAHKRGVPVLVDTDGDALEISLEAQPTVVTPNQHEAERLLSRALITRNQFREAAGRIRAMGARNVVLSLGARGAVAAIETGQVFEIVPPRVDVLCPIGAGDALAAAFVWAADRGCDLPDASRWGVAAGTASARMPGVSFATPDQVKEVYRQVEVRPLD